MTINHRIRLLAAASTLATLVGAGAAYGQRSAASSTSQPVVARAKTSTTTAHASARNTVSPRTRSRLSSTSQFDGGSFGVFNPIATTGLGFGNFGFLGSQNQNLAIEAAIDPATQWRLYEARKFLGNAGFTGSGFYLLDDGAYYAVPSDSADTDQSPQQQQPQQPIVIVQAPQNGQQTEASAQSEQSAAYEQSAEEVGQFVIVLRSGKQIQAVAFSRSGDRIIYITAEGTRHSLALADVDTQSTVRVNDERGTPVQLSL